MGPGQLAPAGHIAPFGRRGRQRGQGTPVPRGGYFRTRKAVVYLLTAAGSSPLAHPARLDAHYRLPVTRCTSGPMTMRKISP